ncbi:MAG: hypothetical protein SGJ10_02160 [Bacteroidota bacterium]|nr:hypothetical protein [Bacteroidota bacterium]
MKKTITILCLVSIFAACKHKTNNDPLKSDDLTFLWTDKPADLDIKIMGYNISLDGKLTYGILDIIDNTDKTKRRSLVNESKLYVNSTLINSSQNSSSLNPFLEGIFNAKKCTVSCKNIESAGYDDFSKEVKLAAPIKSRSVLPKHIKNERVPVSVKWSIDNASTDEQVVIQVHFSTVSSSGSSGKEFTWNKITEDDGEFTIPVEIYKEVNVGYVDVTIYRGNTNSFKDKNGKSMSISSVFKAGTGFFVNQ